MARKKRASDELYNARRRIRRAAGRAEKRGESERARQLRAMAEETYAGRGASSNIERAASAAVAALRVANGVSRRQELRDSRAARERNQSMISALRHIASGSPSARQGFSQLGRAIDARRREKIGRENAIFATQLNIASAGGESALDRPDLTGKSQARIFWMSTRKFWMGSDPSERYQKIMDGLGVDRLEDAFNLVMDFNQRAVDKAIEVERPVRDTLTDMIDERGDESVNIGSPPEFMYFVRDAMNIPLALVG